MPPETAELRRWLEKAEHDRRSAEGLLGLDPPITDTAAFHCQQAVEKLLKAFLFAHSVPFERTHDRRALVVTCATIDPTFGTLRDRVAELTPYGVRFRYPGPDDPTLERVREALGVVMEVERFVGARLPDTSS